MTDLALAWSVAFERYVSTVRMGGTPEQRVWAFARSMAALDSLMVSELHAGAGRDTEEMEAA